MARLSGTVAEADTISCPSTLVCYVGGYRSAGRGGVLVATTNGGASWTNQPLPSRAAQVAVTAISCFRAGDCKAIGAGFSTSTVLALSS